MVVAKKMHVAKKMSKEELREDKVVTAVKRLGEFGQRNIRYIAGGAASRASASARRSNYIFPGTMRKRWLDSRRSRASMDRGAPRSRSACSSETVSSRSEIRPRRNRHFAAR